MPSNTLLMSLATKPTASAAVSGVRWAMPSDLRAIMVVSAARARMPTPRQPKAMRCSAMPATERGRAAGRQARRGEAGEARRGRVVRAGRREKEEARQGWVWGLGLGLGSQP